jgi:hypothetical protein
LLREPSDEFIRFAVKNADLVDGSVTQRVVERFRPLVRDAISAAILEIVGQSFMTGPVVQTPVAQPSLLDAGLGADVPVPDTSDGIRSSVTTEEELQTFSRISEMVAPHVPEPQKLAYRDTSGYFAVQYGVSTRWFARFCLDRREKAVLFRLPVDLVRDLAPEFNIDEPNKSFGASRLYFNSTEELERLQPVFVAAVQEVVG